MLIPAGISSKIAFYKKEGSWFGWMDGRMDSSQEIDSCPKTLYI